MGIEPTSEVWVSRPHCLSRGNRDSELYGKTLGAFPSRESNCLQSSKSRYLRRCPQNHVLSTNLSGLRRLWSNVFGHQIHMFLGRSQTLSA
jgi:hypothetical protein